MGSVDVMAVDVTATVCAITGVRAAPTLAQRIWNTLADSACSSHINSLAPAVALPAPRHDRRRTGAAGSPPGGFPFFEGRFLSVTAGAWTPGHLAQLIAARFKNTLVSPRAAQVHQHRVPWRFSLLRNLGEGAALWRRRRLLRERPRQGEARRPGVCLHPIPARPVPKTTRALSGTPSAPGHVQLQPNGRIRRHASGIPAVLCSWQPHAATQPQ
jgi:hypothetical protein